MRLYQDYTYDNKLATNKEVLKFIVIVSLCLFTLNSVITAPDCGILDSKPKLWNQKMCG